MLLAIVANFPNFTASESKKCIYALQDIKSTFLQVNKQIGAYMYIPNEFLQPGTLHLFSIVKSLFYILKFDYGVRKYDYGICLKQCYTR